MNLLVSIIMPCYNSAKFVEKAIQSILNQTYQNFELIIINDFSTDGSLEIIKSFKKNDKRIIVLSNEENKGVSITRNRGLKICSGDYIAFCDADDFWEPFKLEEQLRIFNNDTQYRLSFTNSYIVDERSNKTGETFRQKFGFKIDRSGKYFNQILYTNFINTSTAILNRKNIKLKLFNPEISIGEDWLFWLEIAKEEKMLYIDEPYSYYRVHKEMSTGKGTEKMALARIKTLSELLKMKLDLNSREQSKIYYFIGVEWLKINAFTEANKNLIISINKNPLNVKSLVRYALNCINSKTEYKINRKE